MKTAHAGYSLIEVLITLVIVGLIMGLLFEGIGGAARLSLRLTDKAAQLDRDLITADWWRMSVISMSPAEADTPSTFSGDARRLEFDTVSPLHARIGAMRRIRWELTTSTTGSNLSYVFDETAWTLAQSRNERSHFSYCCNSTGEWTDRWDQPAPPRYIALLDFYSAPIIAHPRSRRVAPQPGATGELAAASLAP